MNRQLNERTSRITQHLWPEDSVYVSIYMCVCHNVFVLWRDFARIITETTESNETVNRHYPLNGRDWLSLHRRFRFISIAKTQIILFSLNKFPRGRSQRYLRFYNVIYMVSLHNLAKRGRDDRFTIVGPSLIITHQLFPAIQNHRVKHASRVAKEAMPYTAHIYTCTSTHVVFAGFAWFLLSLVLVDAAWRPVISPPPGKTVSCVANRISHSWRVSCHSLSPQLPHLSSSPFASGSRPSSFSFSYEP